MFIKEKRNIYKKSSIFLGKSIMAGIAAAAVINPTPLGDIAGIVSALRASFRKRCDEGIGGDASAADLDRRRSLLLSVKNLVKENEDALLEAVTKDLGRHPSFTKKIIAGCSAGAQKCIDNLEAWTAKREKGSAWGNPCEVHYLPRGVVLIVGTWNFPVPLVLKPLCAALAAGNNVIIKLSEVCENVSALLGPLIEKYLPSDAVRVVLGAIPESTELLKQKFDMIFYTGNTFVGKVIMRAAAEHLTPCVLELGGKNPAIVAADANLRAAAKKIIDGRMKNTGQFCVAPDHVIADESIKDELVKHMVDAVREFWGPNAQQSPSYSRIINRRHAKRLVGLLESNHGGKVACGGTHDVSDRYVAPTIIVDPAESSDLMQSEIFGPILPVTSFPSGKIARVVETVNSRPSPLALYVFTSSDDIADCIITRIHSGGACVNDVIIHMLNEVLPFGGCGASGMGSYHGEYGFKAFSHEKGVMRAKSADDGGKRYPPYA